MQHTEKYKLNLIETSDTFSPDALNENMEKVEAAITAETDALDQRVVALEAKKMAIGWYNSGNEGTVTVDLGFTPKAVIIACINYYGGGTSIVLVTDSPAFYHYSSSGNVKIEPNGFSAKPSAITGKFNYVAFA